MFFYRVVYSEFRLITQQQKILKILYFSNCSEQFQIFFMDIIFIIWYRFFFCINIFWYNFLTQNILYVHQNKKSVGFCDNTQRPEIYTHSSGKSITCIIILNNICWYQYVMSVIRTHKMRYTYTTTIILYNFGVIT